MLKCYKVIRRRRRRRCCINGDDDFDGDDLKRTTLAIANVKVCPVAAVTL